LGREERVLRRGLEQLAATEPAALQATPEQFRAPELMAEVWTGR